MNSFYRGRMNYLAINHKYFNKFDDAKRKMIMWVKFPYEGINAAVIDSPQALNWITAIIICSCRFSMYLGVQHMCACPFAPNVAKCPCFMEQQHGEFLFPKDRHTYTHTLHAWAKTADGAEWSSFPVTKALEVWKQLQQSFCCFSQAHTSSSSSSSCPCLQLLLTPPLFSL